MKHHLKKAMLPVAIILIILMTLASCSKPNGTTETEKAAVVLSSGINFENMNKKVKPGDDFFEYANGTWLEKTKIPDDKASYGAFQILRDKAQEDVMEIIKSSAEGDFEINTEQQKVGGLYNSLLNTTKRDELGLTPLQPELDRIDTIENYKQLAEYFGYANKFGYSIPFNIAQFVDFKDPNSYMIYSWQAGLGLPEREYYFSADAKSVEIREKYLAHIEKVMLIAGFDQAATKANTIMMLETTLAAQHMKKEKTRDMVALYNKIPLAELSELMPNFDWQALLEEARLTDLDGIVVTQLDYMREVDKIIADTDLDTWKTYLKWGVINTNASRLTSELDAANFEFYSKTLYGVEQQRPMWRRAVNLVNAHLGEVVGKVYVKEHFSAEAKNRMMELVNNLLKAYEISITELDWMTDETKAEALDKLSKFTAKIGYPDEWKDYSGLTIDKDDLFGNLKRSAVLKYQQLLDKQKGPVNKHEWNMTPQTVNAYYNPPMNEIVFPAAILHPPFFNMEAEDAVNYGGIGAIIGHEIGHGFDDAGSTFDGNGVLRDWWTEADKQEFKNRTKQLVAQYNGYEAANGVFVNGEFTLGENIGDLGGISIALKAYERSLAGKESPTLDGFTGQQRVFLGFGQVWANKYRDETLRTLIETDSHSPTKFRANGSLRNVPEFYQAFSVKEGDALYLIPEQRVKIW